MRGIEEGMFISIMFALLQSSWTRLVVTEDYYTSLDDFKHNLKFNNSANASLVYEVQMDAISNHQLQIPPRMKSTNQRSMICIPITHKKFKHTKLSYRHDFNDSNITEDSPLQRAARLGREQEVAYLLSSGMNACTAGMFKRTPLHWAAYNGFSGIVMLLIVNGANTNSRDKWDYTPLHLAAENGHIEPVQILIKNGASTNTKNIEGRTPLLDAARNGYLDLLSILLDFNINLSVSKPYLSTPLHESVIGNHINLVKYLIGRGTDLNAMDEMKRTPLHWAVFYNYEDLVFLLISKGSGLNRKDCDGMSPLHISAMKGYKKITEMLMKYGAFKNSRSKKGHTPLHEAAHNGQKEIVQLLIKEGAELENPGSEASDGSTPLFEAVEGGYSEIVRILIDHGARFNLTNSMGKKTPLHRAVEKDNKEIVNLLVQKGADITAEDYWGYTPFAIACEQGNMEILQQLFHYCVCYNYTKNCQCLSVGNDVVGLPIACQCIAAKQNIKDEEVISVTAKSVSLEKCPCFMIKSITDNKEACTAVPQVETASRGLCLKASDFSTKKFDNRSKKINCPSISNSGGTNSTVCIGHVVKYFRNMLDNSIMFH